MLALSKAQILQERECSSMALFVKPHYVTPAMAHPSGGDAVAVGAVAVGAGLAAVGLVVVLGGRAHGEKIS
jgi:hypothetical protein